MDTAWIPVAKDIATSMAAIGGIAIAGLGLKTWSRQLRGHTEYELARRLLRAAYGVRDEIPRVRAPFMSVAEMNAAVEAAGAELEDPTDPMRYAYGVHARLRELQKAVTNLDVEVLEAEVLWGEGIRAACGELRRLCLHLSIDAEEHVRERLRPRDDGTDDYVTRMQRVFATSEDPFGASVKAAVQAIEDQVRPKLKI